MAAEVESLADWVADSSSKEVEGCRVEEVLSSILFAPPLINRTRLWQLVSEYEAGSLSTKSACST